MSDLPQGPGWWRASDGLYYPPEARPGSTPDDTEFDDARDRGARPDEPVVEEGAPVDEASMADEPTLADTPAVGPAADDDIAVTEPTRPAVINEDLYDRDWPVNDEVEPEGRRLWPILAVVAVVGLLAGLAIWFVLDGNDDSDTAGATTSTTDPDATPTTDPATTLPTDNAVSPFVLAAGDCFDAGELAADGSLLVNVRVVECEGPHQAEVVAIEDLDAPSDEAFPGDEARDSNAQELCTPIVEDFLGGLLAESSLLLLWLAPTEESWADGDREVVCVVAAPDGSTLTGSSADTLGADAPDQTEDSPDETDEDAEPDAGTGEDAEN